MNNNWWLLFKYEKVFIQTVYIFISPTQLWVEKNTL